MKQTISVVVPVYNEIGNVPAFHRALLKALKTTAKPYEIIYVDDNSTDGTYEWLKKKQKHSSKATQTHIDTLLKSISAVRVLRKKGKQGKAYSLLEGFAASKGSILVMIDGDMQYPPEAIPGMVAELLKPDVDIVVAKRKNYKDNMIRKVLSNGFQKMVGKVFGLSTDIQSGLKVFKRQVYLTAIFEPTSSWTFDLEFLHRASQAGFVIKNFDITFSERLSGKSKINIVKQVCEIGANAINVRFKKAGHFTIPSDTQQSMQGAGVGYHHKKYITHTTLPFSLSAAQTFSVGQKLFIWAILGVVISGLINSPLTTLQFLVAFLSILYFLDTVFNFLIVLRSLKRREEVRVSKREIEQIDEKKLPYYTILCPLYKEPHVVPQFVEAISSLEWPKEKLDVMLLLEEDDVETIDIIGAMDLPSYIRTVIVPDSQPKTKPKACNYGLTLARGDYLVIYDAEDIPDTLQLKKAYLGFQKVPDSVKCLQAKLNFYNARQNWLTRFFTAEYSLWFDLTLTGLQSFRSTIPLGGTSNHFKTANLKQLLGWDPFNVTEDADLGIRLFQKGYRTEILDSTTMEEATSNTKSWLKQRSRWIKGYMQTYLVHMRNIETFINEKGILHMLIFQLTVGGKILFVLINPIMWITTLTYFSLHFYTAPFIEAVFAPPLSYLAVFSLVFGNFMYLYSYMIGIGKRNQWDIMKYVFMIPYYWALMSIASAQALVQLIFKPHYWEKTAHGFHLETMRTPVIARKHDEAIPDLSRRPQGIAALSLVARNDVTKMKPTFISTLFGILLIQVPFAAYFNTTLQGLTDSMLFLVGVDLLVMAVLFFKPEYINVFFNNISSLTGIFQRNKEQAWEHNNLKILIFNWRDTKHVYAGGAEVYIHELAKRWVRDGNKVTIFCGNDNRNPRYETIDGVEVIRRGGTYTVYFFAVMYYLISLKRKYDVIIDCENGIPFFTPLYVKKPVILLIHHVHQDVFRKFLRFPLRQIAGTLEGKLMPLLYRNKQVITVSDSSKAEIARLGFIKAESIEVIHNGVHLPASFAYNKTPYPSFTYLGRLKDYKNIDVAILAFAQVVKEFPDAKLFIAGQGESIYDLYEIVNRFGLSDHVEFLGRVSESQKTALLAESWVVLQPSQMEGWGISVIEANSHGTPVIASRVNGLKDSVKDNVTGLLVEPGDIQGFADAMKTLVTDTEYRKQLSYAAYTWAHQFNWNDSAAQFYMTIGRSLKEGIVSKALSKLAVSTK